MPDVKNNIIWTLRDQVSGGTAKLNKELTALGAKGTATGSIMQRLGVATGGLVTPQTMVAAGALAVAGGLTAATKAAIDEERNIAKLDAALRANIVGWDGNRDAIEALIKEREGLAFSDDDLRDSMALLVAATRDVGQAQRVQTAAMDLARLKGISLKEASEALIKVEGGQFRMLKSLGIVLKDGATAQDALTEVQRRATGQAEAYAATVQGKAEVAQIRFNDKMEELGLFIMPTVTEAIEDLIDVLDDAPTPMSEWEEAAAKGNEVAIALIANMRRMRTTGQVLDDAMAVHGQDLEDTLTDVAETSAAVSSDITHHAEDIGGAWAEMVSKAKGDAQSLVGDFFDPIKAEYELVANRAEASALRKKIAAKDGTKAEIREWKAALVAIEEDNLQLAFELLAAGKLNKKEQGALLSDLQEKLKASSGAGRIAIQRIIDKFLELARLTAPGIDVRATVGWRGHAPGRGPLERDRAAGGPVEPYEVIRWREAGDEYLQMGGQGGYVHPHGGTSGGGGRLEVPLVVDGRVLARVLFPHISAELFDELSVEAPTMLSA